MYWYATREEDFQINTNDNGRRKEFIRSIRTGDTQIETLLPVVDRTSGEPKFPIGFQSWRQTPAFLHRFVLGVVHGTRLQQPQAPEEDWQVKIRRPDQLVED